MSVRLRSAGAVVLAALALTGCGLGAGGATPGAAPAVAAKPVKPARPVLQEANGPLLSGPPPAPLAVKLGTPNLIAPHFKVPPRAGLLFDFDSGQVLWSRNPTRVLPIASITKLMTALLVAERLPQHTTVKITKEALRYQGSGVGVLPKGKRVGLQAMLYGLMLASGNDAAIALSQRVSGTLKEFVAQMNAKAAAMHLQCTHFTRPDGFEDKGNHSCAYDLAALGKAVLSNARLKRIVRRASVVLPFPIKGGKLYLYNHNPLLKTHYRGTIGLKTGFTDAAGHSLVAAVRRHGRTLGVVLLHSPNILKQSRKLFDQGFADVAR
jgi:D-alanyl-D-alanine carboxypeptidase (penicillin-binding protein 5/6)